MQAFAIKPLLVGFVTLPFRLKIGQDNKRINKAEAAGPFTPRPANLLHEINGTIKLVNVHDYPDINKIDTGTKGNGCDNLRAMLVKLPPGEIAGLFLVRQTGVINGAAI